ncbi:hypothetical protein L226DRAFT_517852 [Lentinus tigrinus ALCF2SS1-7]|uniref:SWIM-type domain-containing protein n=1 Tax=Lentinus tigrinus ALCF2SS1-6 TaxID=1328759 RepID=A0A5C2RPW6_9APHY|nr:hypothetical protein L227DRAFT_512818 [Lentinus tigrinus ALCF2SS1-6]RPD67676.1 hypothetical protein L226DRAFT_517856 [Lentinus tigrinus ALCF2SS1-7]RPD67689.1 hypothetical protein L226DRAFT_517852 [Lentinus tigrinus ALCF2SS1-7]
MSKACSDCHVMKPLEEFGLRVKDSNGGKKGEPTAMCLACTTKASERRKIRKRKLMTEADGGEEDSLGVDQEGLTGNLNVISLTDFINVVWRSEAPVHVQGRVDVASVAPLDLAGRKRADCVAIILGEYTNLHRTYEAKCARKRSGAMVYSYSCAQSAERAHKEKIPKNERSRDTRRMPRFQCRGWLHLTILPESLVVEIAIKLNFSSKSVYYYWHVVSREEWKLDNNPITSACKFIKEKGDTYHVALLDVQAEPGTRVLTFQVTDFVQEWARNTQELAMDSTWNTNGANFELFAAVADAKGSGLPLAFLLMQTTKEAASGAKEAVLERFLRTLRGLGVHPEFTLSDKDWSEINAMHKVWPNAKHQLCFWHALRALKQRLAKNRETPAAYNAEAARETFDFIDATFVPVAQQDENEGIPQIPAPPEKPLPRVRLLVNGQPSEVTVTGPKIVLTREAIAKALSKLDDNSPEDVDDHDSDLGDGTETFNVEAASGSSVRPPNEGEMYGMDGSVADEVDPDGDDTKQSGFWADHAEAEEWGDEEAEADWSEIEDDLRHQVDEFVADDTNIDVDAPIDPGDTSSHSQRASNYQFCPLPHRLPILRLFAKHASQHPLLPERHGQTLSSEEIWRNAVAEMYYHCRANNLCDVWAYLWNSWYSPTRWALWARSAYATSIPCKRTTMMVEALWRNLKRLVLHLYNRPPVDLAVYAIITKALPPYRLSLFNLVVDSRAGRAKSLTQFQQALKRSWTRLTKVPIRGSYQTSVEHWTCNCGAQKYHAYVLCKHLVHAAGQLPTSWWPTAVRYHLPPFYTLPVDGVTTKAPEETHHRAWLSRMPRTYAESDPGVKSDGVYIPTDADERRTSSPIQPSPAKAPRTGHDGLMRMGAGGGAGFELDDEDDIDVDEMIRLLRRSIDILQEQRDEADPRFIENAKQRMRGVFRWTRNIDRHVARRTLPKTNAQGRGEGGAATDVIGYHYPERSARS